jgi:uncharacterized protein (TIGR03435 family)
MLALSTMRQGRDLFARSVAAVVTAVALAGEIVTAQSAGTGRFDVASVKPNDSGSTQSASFVQPGGRYTATNVTVRTLVKAAYGLHDSQLIGGPNWLDRERFDIAAKAEGYDAPSAFRDQARLMLRPLLADRFKLVVRHEARDLPVYVMVLARKDGRFGAQFRRSPVDDCSGPPKAMQTATGASEPEIPLPCGAEVYRPGHLAARGMRPSILALNISRWADRVVVDRTRLDGTFDWDVQWVPDNLSTDATTALEGPSLFSALREQAGLRLERGRASVDVLIVEAVERPDPD